MYNQQVGYGKIRNLNSLYQKKSKHLEEKIEMQTSQAALTPHQNEIVEIPKKTVFIQRAAITFTMLLVLIVPGLLDASEISLSKGQTVYVPVYSNVIAGPKKVPVYLSNTLIIRNTDIHNAIQISTANYYDTKGALIKTFTLNR